MGGESNPVAFAWESYTVYYPAQSSGHSATTWLYLLKLIAEKIDLH